MPGTDPKTKENIALEVRDLGRMPYAEAFELQQQLQQQVIAGRDSGGISKGYLLLVEHDPPVITISRRKGARKNLIASDEQLAKAGIEISETNRGGDITYHGPGQLVAYPILDLNVLKLRIHSYMRFLEQVVIDTLAQFGIKGQRDKCATGVWVTSPPPTPTDSNTSPPPTPTDSNPWGSYSAVTKGEQNNSQKICAMGVRISRWVSMHGLALNVTTNLNHFNLIIPCGLVDRKVTTMQHQLGNNCPTIKEVKQSLTTNFHQAVESLKTETKD